MPPPAWIGCGIALILLAVSLHLRKRQRLLRDLPTSKVRGVFIGLVEVAGTAESAAPFTGFLSGKLCVHYSYDVEERWSRTVTETYQENGKTRTRTRRESGWTSVADGGQSAPFYLRDDTGALLIRPKGAKLEPVTLFEETVSRGHPLYYHKGPPHAVGHSDHVRRFVERGLPLHQPLYVVGQARERDDIVAPEIAQDKTAPLFLISTRTEKSVQSGYAGWSWFCWVLGLVPLVVGAAVYSRDARDTGQLLALAAGLYLVLWGLGWVWMVFNSLVGLRHRVRQAWSLIDVQLKRRHDLLPGLVTAVSALSAHEQSVQTALAELRTQATATKPGTKGPDFDGVAGSLRAVIEAYPQLTAQPAFTRLHEELVETEERIALARAYYNDIATYFATRLEQVPDRFVARLGGMKPEPLLSATHFERAPVDISLTPQPPPA